MEVANSRGLCTIADGAKRFNGERTAPFGGERTEARPDAPALSPFSAASSAGDSGSSTDRASATSEESGIQEMAGVGRAGDVDVPRRAPRGRSRQGETRAEKAAKIIAAGGRAGGRVGAHPVQKTCNAVLEGLVWSLAGRGDADGVSEKNGHKTISVVAAAAVDVTAAAAVVVMVVVVVVVVAAMAVECKSPDLKQLPSRFCTDQNEHCLRVEPPECPSAVATGVVAEACPKPVTEQYILVQDIMSVISA